MIQNGSNHVLKPLTFSIPEAGRGRGNSVYPFHAKANRALTRMEQKVLREFCEQTFGQGGRMPDLDNRWFGDGESGFYAFKSETDRVVFVAMMSG